MAGKNKDAIRNALAQVVSYNGGNQFGAVAAGVADAIKDIPVVDATSGNVTLTADQSGACVFAGGGARTITLPAVAAGINFKIVSTTAHNHIISGSAGDLTSLVYTGIDNTNGTTIARMNITNKCAITLANAKIGEQLELVSDGSKHYIKGDLNDTPTAT